MRNRQRKWSGELLVFGGEEAVRSNSPGTEMTEMDINGPTAQFTRVT